MFLVILGYYEVLNTVEEYSFINICCLFRHYMYVESNQSFYPKFKGGLYKR